MNKIVVTLLGIFALIFLAKTSSADAIKEGKWTMTMVTKLEGMSEKSQAAMKEMENMPPEAKAMMEQMQGAMGMKMNVSGKGITTTVTQCMTQKNPVPDTDMPENCKETHDINGNTVTFNIVCDNKDMKMDSSGKVTYNDETMEGLIKSHQIVDGRPMNATIEVSGKYEGPCEK